MLNNKVAIVTGGTRGIGYAVVKKYLENRASVVLCGSRQETADRAVARLKAEHPDWPVEGIAPDLTDYASVKAAFDGVRERYGRIDILVNNAGVSSSEPLSDYTPELFRRVMALNVDAVFYCVRAVYDAMAAQGAGCILNTSSMVSRYGQPSQQGRHQRHDPLPGPGAGPPGHPGQRRSPRHHQHGHDAESAPGGHRPPDQPDSPAPHRRTGGPGRRLPLPGQRCRLLYHRRDSPRSRPGQKLTPTSHSAENRPELQGSGRFFHAYFPFQAIFSRMWDSRSRASSRVSSFFAKWTRTISLTFSLKKDVPGTQATPTFRAISSQKSTSVCPFFR